MTRALHLARRLRPSPPPRRDCFPPGTTCIPWETAASADPLMGLAATQDLAAHLERFGERPRATGPAGAALLTLIEEASLTGHGGGHFPVSRKWRTVLRNGGAGIVVANGAESEPASAKDRALLATVPHLVLDGLALATEVLGAEDAVIWMHQDSSEAARAVSSALSERRAHGFAEIVARKVLTPASYLSGESSAILQGLTGGPVLPTFAREPAAVSGYRGRPALVQNVETLARIGILARLAARAYDPTALVTVTSRDSRTVLELDQDATIGDAVRLARWRGAPPQAVLVGGYGGSWLPWTVAADIPLRGDALRSAGASLGAGVLIPLAQSECGINETARIAAFLADSGARQCGPCRFGLPALAEGLAALAASRGSRRGVKRLEEMTKLVDGRGGCHHPDGAARLISSALRTFADDAAGHARGQRCAAARVPLVGVH